MKRKILPLAAAAMLIAVFIFTGCGYDYAAKPPVYSVFTPSGMETVLEDFLDNCPDRTSFSAGEKNAAAYLEERLAAQGLAVSRQELSYRYSYSQSVFGGGGIEHTFGSQNVIAVIKGKSAAGGAGKIVIGAYYDNYYAYSGLYEGFYVVNGLEYTGDKGGLNAEAALGATGAAASLALAGKLAEFNASDAAGLPFDVEFVFFGAEMYGCLGSATYAGSAANIGSAELYISLARIGGDNIYAYFDEVDTGHGGLFMECAGDLGYGEMIKQPDASQTLIGGSTTGGKLPYSNYALTGSAGVMMGAGVKIASITTGNWETVLLSDRESAGYMNIMNTSSDTRTRLAAVCPQYSAEMAVAADTVYAAVTGGGLTAALGLPSYDYAWLTYPLAGFLTVIALAVVLVIVLVLLVRHFEKKYPPAQKKAAKVKVAVFGMDYENPDDADIFIDTKAPGGVYRGAQPPAADPFADDGGEDDKPD